MLEYVECMAGVGKLAKKWRQTEGMEVILELVNYIIFNTFLEQAYDDGFCFN